MSLKIGLLSILTFMVEYPFIPDKVMTAHTVVCSSLIGLQSASHILDLLHLLIGPSLVYWSKESTIHHNASVVTQEELTSNMVNQDCGHVVGIPVTRVSLQKDLSSVAQSDRMDISKCWTDKLRRKAGRYLQSIRQQVRSGPKNSEAVKENLSLNSQIVQAGGVERVFKQVFHVKKGEMLLKVSQCYLSTTAGPIAGIVFISTEKVAFHSNRLIKLSCPDGQLVRVPYKVLIPQTMIKRIVASESGSTPCQKYIQMVTKDDFEFWFMGSLSYQQSFKHLPQALDYAQTTSCN